LREVIEQLLISGEGSLQKVVFKNSLRGGKWEVKFTSNDFFRDVGLK
jgi:hypothetical protein